MSVDGEFAMWWYERMCGMIYGWAECAIVSDDGGRSVVRDLERRFFCS